MEIDAWIWQFGKDYPGEVGNDDQRLPFASVYIKTNDGNSWQGQFDDHPAEISGLEAVKVARTTIYQPQGIGMMPWGVVQGVNRNKRDISAEEGKRAGQIAVAAAGAGEPARYIVDLEPYYHGGPNNPQFWRNDLGAGPAHVQRFIEAFVAAGGQELWVAPDARTAHLPPVSFQTWADSPTVTAILPQVYFTDFRQPARVALDHALITLADYRVGPSRIRPVLPGNAEPAPLLDAITYSQAKGCTGVSFWRRGSFRVDSLQAIAGLTNPWGPEPPREEVPREETPREDAPRDDHLRSEIDDLLDEAAELGARVQTLVTQARRKNRVV
ncbi:MAG: hypothetical protein M0R75_06470 [Dehalococcoidia bacterium]|nr:hypothetical protein [Dehalococcoidia bacterium]